MSACRTDILRHLKDDASLDQPPALLIETTILRRLLTSPPADAVPGIAPRIISALIASHVPSPPSSNRCRRFSPEFTGSTVWLTGSKTGFKQGIRFDSPNPGVGIVAGLLVVDCPGINGCISRARKGQTLSGCRGNLGAVS